MASIRIDCDLPGHEGEYIEGSDQITRGRKKAWLQEPDDFKSEVLALTFISGWKLSNLDGSPAPEPTSAEAFNGLHEQTVRWVFKAVTLLINEAAQLPLPKSSA